MAHKKKKRNSSDNKPYCPYPYYEELIRAMAEGSVHAQDIDKEERIRGALLSLFGDWKSVDDCKTINELDEERDLLSIASLMNQGLASNAREATRKYFRGGRLAKIAKRDGIEEESLIRRYTVKLNKELDYYKNMTAKDQLYVIMKGRPFCKHRGFYPVYTEGCTIAAWIVKHQNLMDHCKKLVQK